MKRMRIDKIDVVLYNSLQKREKYDIETDQKWRDYDTC